MSETVNKFDDCDFDAVRSWLKLPDVPAALIASCDDLLEALDVLERAGFLIEAAQVVAHALPKRESVWWACMCADHTAPAVLPAADQAAREAAEEWVRYQTDLLRRNAMGDAETAEYNSPEAWAAVAAFWSDGSLAPPDKPVVRPAPKLTGTAVSAALRLAAVRGDPSESDARLRLFLASARDIAEGGTGRIADNDAEATVRKRYDINELQDEVTDREHI